MTYDQILEGTKWTLTLSLLGLALTTGGAISGFVILTQDPQNHAVSDLTQKNNMQERDPHWLRVVQWGAPVLIAVYVVAVIVDLFRSMHP